MKWLYSYWVISVSITTITWTWMTWNDVRIVHSWAATIQTFFFGNRFNLVHWYMRQLSMFTSHNPLDFGWLAKWHPRYIGAHFQGNPFLGKPTVSRIFRNKTYLDRKFIKGTIMPEITTGGKHIESLFLFLLLVGSCCCVGRWQNSFSRSNLTTKNHQKTTVNLDF